jgi:multidrug efflux pump subunit AcrA (membrane-fusion protein)
MLLRRTTLLSLVSLGGAALLTACRSSPPPPVTIPIVPVATVGTATLANDLTLTAEFLPYQDVDVMAKVAGYVKSISVDIGDHVQQGQVLAVLEAPEIQSDVARAKAGVAAAEANIVTAQAAVQRAQATAGMTKLSFQRLQEVATKDKGLVPRQDIDVAQSRQMEAEAQLASAESSVQAARDAKAGADQEYVRAQTMMGYATIRAPFAGGGHEALRQHRFNDSSWHRLTNAGNAIGKARAEQSLTPHSPGSGERCRRREQWTGRRCECVQSWADIAGHRDSIGGFGPDGDAHDGYRS